MAKFYRSTYTTIDSIIWQNAGTTYPVDSVYQRFYEQSFVQTITRIHAGYLFRWGSDSSKQTFSIGVNLGASLLSNRNHFVFSESLTYLETFYLNSKNTYVFNTGNRTLEQRDQHRWKMGVGFSMEVPFLGV